MKRTSLRILSFLLLFLLSALALTACGGEGGSGTTAATTTGTPSPETPALPAIWDTATHRADATLGEGSHTVTVKVTADGFTVTLTLRTDAETLADALLSEELCAGEDSQYGLMISHVNGIRADYDLDRGYYWNILVDGEVAMTGASGIAIPDGAVYELVRKK